MDAGTRMAEQTYQDLSLLTLAAGILTKNKKVQNTLLLAASCFNQEAEALRLLPENEVPVRRTRRSTLSIDFDSFDEEKYEIYIGFTKLEVLRLYNVLSMPDAFVLNEGDHQFHVSAQHCFLYFLSRYHSPSQRQALDMDMWQYDYTVLSKMFNAVVTYVDDNHSFRLQQIMTLSHKFSYFNEKIKAKVCTIFPNEPLPPDVLHCALFADVSRFKISRPLGEYWRQYAFYSKHKHMHCHGAQGVFGPDGMFYDWWDEPVGRRNDKFFMSDSGVNWLMHQIEIEISIELRNKTLGVHRQRI